MRKTMLLLVLFIACLCSYGQVRYGITGGGILSRLNEEFNSDNRVGFYLGAVADLKIGKSLSLRPQLQFIQKGEHYHTGEEGIYNYLELPVNFVYNIPSTLGRFYLGGGPVLSYMMSGSWTLDGQPKEILSFEVDEINRFDFGINAMAGYELKGGFFFNVNYTLGFSDVWTEPGLETTKNRVFGFGIGMMIK